MGVAPNRRARHVARLRAEGGRPVYLHLSPAAARALERLQAGGASIKEAVEAALLAASPPPLEADVTGWLRAAELARGRAAD